MGPKTNAAADSATYQTNTTADIETVDTWRDLYSESTAYTTAESTANPTTDSATDPTTYSTPN